MKKRWTQIICVLLTVAFLTACGNTTENTQTSNTSSNRTENSSTPAPATAQPDATQPNAGQNSTDTAASTGTDGDSAVNPVHTEEDIMTLGEPIYLLPEGDALSAGDSTSFVVPFYGSLWGWGNNDGYRIGDGTRTNRHQPVQIMNLNIIEVSAGEKHTLARDDQGNVWAWGDNSSGQIGDGWIAETSRNMAGKEQLTPVNFYSNPVKIIPGGAKAVSAGAYHSMAIDYDGKLWGWGNNWNGQLGNATKAQDSRTPLLIMENVAAISAAGSHTLVLRTDGKMYVLGNHGLGPAQSDSTGGYFGPGGATFVMDNIASVFAGHHHNMAIDYEGNLWGWGSNTYRELGYSNSSSDGSSTRNLYGNQRPEKLPLSDVAYVSLGYNPTQTGSISGFTLALRTDGTLWAWGAFDVMGESPGKAGIEGIKKVMDNVVSVSAGGGYGIALSTDGNLWAFGKNEHGQLGDGTTDSSNKPKLLDFYTGWFDYEDDYMLYYTDDEYFDDFGNQDTLATMDARGLHYDYIIDGRPAIDFGSIEDLDWFMESFNITDVSGHFILDGVEGYLVTYGERHAFIVDYVPSGN